LAFWFFGLTRKFGPIGREDGRRENGPCGPLPDGYVQHDPRANVSEQIIIEPAVTRLDPHWTNAWDEGPRHAPRPRVSGPHQRQEHGALHGRRERSVSRHLGLARLKGARRRTMRVWLIKYSFALPFPFGGSAALQQEKFYLIVIVIFFETSGGLNG
jgi:hypothetical protein